MVEVKIQPSKEEKIATINDLRETPKKENHVHTRTSINSIISSEQKAHQDRSIQMQTIQDQSALATLRSQHADILGIPEIQDHIRSIQTDSDPTLAEKPTGIENKKGIEKFKAKTMDVAIATPGEILTSTEKNERIEEFHKELQEADNFFFVTSYKIGDTLMEMSYIEAMINKLQTLNTHAEFTVVVSSATYSLLKSLEERMPRLTIVKGQQETSDAGLNYEGIGSKEGWEPKGRHEVATILAQKETPSTAFIFDFEDIFTPLSKEYTYVRDADITYFDGLFGMTTNYDNLYGEGRYNTFSNLLLQENTPLAYKRAEIPLPKDHEDQYREIAKRCDIDTTKDQVSIILESGSTGRQYSIEQYVEAVKIMQERHPDLAFNFIVNRKKSPEDPTIVDEAKLTRLLSEKGITDAHIVSGSLSELVSLFNKQKLIVSNDGGILHIAGATEGAPPVIGIFLPNLGEFWSADPDSIIPLEPEIREDEHYNPAFSETDETKKSINTISPSKIADTAETIALKTK